MGFNGTVDFDPAQVETGSDWHPKNNFELGYFCTGSEDRLDDCLSWEVHPNMLAKDKNFAWLNCTY